MFFKKHQITSEYLHLKRLYIIIRKSRDSNIGNRKNSSYGGSYHLWKPYYIYY